MPRVNLFKQNSPHPDGPQTHSAPFQRIHSLTESPGLISQESHIDGVGQLSPDREKELGAHPRTPSPPPP